MNKIIDIGPYQLRRTTRQLKTLGVVIYFPSHLTGPKSRRRKAIRKQPFKNL